MSTRSQARPKSDGWCHSTPPTHGPPARSQALRMFESRSSSGSGTCPPPLVATGSILEVPLWSRTLSTCHRSTPGNHARNWSTVARAPEVLEERRNGHSRAGKHPGSADPRRVALDGWTVPPCGHGSLAHPAGRTCRSPSCCFAQHSGELVRPRPARHRRQWLDQPQVLVRPDIGGVIEQRDEGERFRSCYEVIQVMPSGEHVFRDPVRRRAIAGAQHLDQRAARFGPHVEVDRPAPSRPADQLLGAVEFALGEEFGYLVRNRLDRLRSEGKLQVGYSERRHSKRDRRLPWGGGAAPYIASCRIMLKLEEHFMTGRARGNS